MLERLLPRLTQEDYRALSFKQRAIFCKYVLNFKNVLSSKALESVQLQIDLLRFMRFQIELLRFLGEVGEAYEYEILRAIFHLALLQLERHDQSEHYLFKEVKNCLMQLQQKAEDEQRRLIKKKPNLLLRAASKPSLENSVELLRASSVKPSPEAPEELLRAAGGQDATDESRHGYSSPQVGEDDR